ncbi:Protein of unknown function [Gryllus bimaculatus]|nr:Protein of unknown function [Gryllus bimaculatus]
MGGCTSPQVLTCGYASASSSVTRRD